MCEKRVGSFYARWTSQNNCCSGKNSVTFAITQCSVHRRSKQRESEAGQRTQERSGRKSCDDQKVCKHIKSDDSEADTAPEAACSVNASIKYAWMLWYVTIVPAPTITMPCQCACPSAPPLKTHSSDHSPRQATARKHASVWSSL